MYSRNSTQGKNKSVLGHKKFGDLKHGIYFIGTMKFINIGTYY